MILRRLRVERLHTGPLVQTPSKPGLIHPQPMGTLQNKTNTKNRAIAIPIKTSIVPQIDIGIMKINQIENTNHNDVQLYSDVQEDKICLGHPMAELLLELIGKASNNARCDSNNNYSDSGDNSINTDSTVPLLVDRIAKGNKIKRRKRK